MRNRGIKTTAIVATALLALLALTSPAAAESITVTVGDCQADGTRQVFFEVDSTSEKIQWVVDGDAWGRPTDADGQTAFVTGDDQVHNVQAVTIPGRVLVDETDVKLPSCGAAATTTTIIITTTAPPSTTAASTTTSTSRDADLFPAWVNGILDDDPDGGLLVRTGPSTNTNRIATLVEGTGVIALADPQTAVWVEIISPVNGWVSAKYLSNEAPTGATTTTETESDSTTTKDPDSDSSTTEATSDDSSTTLEDDTSTTTTDPTASDDTSDSSTSIPDSLPATSDEPVSTASEEGGIPVRLLIGGIAVAGLAGAGLLIAKSRREDDNEPDPALTSATSTAPTTAAAMAPTAPAASPLAGTTAATSATMALNSVTTPRSTGLPASSETPYTPTTPARGSTKPARRKGASAPEAERSAEPLPGGESWDPSQLAAAVSAAKQRPKPEAGRPSPDSVDETAVDGAADASPTAPTAPAKPRSAMPKRQRITPPVDDSSA